MKYSARAPLFLRPKDTVSDHIKRMKRMQYRTRKMDHWKSPYVVRVIRNGIRIRAFKKLDFQQAHLRFPALLDVPSGRIYCGFPIRYNTVTNRDDQTKVIHIIEDGEAPLKNEYKLKFRDDDVASFDASFDAMIAMKNSDDGSSSDSAASSHHIKDDDDDDDW